MSADEFGLRRARSLCQRLAEPVDFGLPVLVAALPAFGDPVELRAAAALVPAGLLAFVAQGVEPRVDLDEVLAGAVELALEEVGVVVAREAVEGELLGAAVGEDARDVIGEVVVGRQGLGCAVEEVGCRADVETRLVAVTRQRGVAPLAVELV